MILNYVRFAIRLMMRSKLFSLTVLAGLTIAVASVVLIADYTQNELSYENSFGNSHRIFRVQHARYRNNELIYSRALSLPEVGIAMGDYFSEIENTTRLFPISVNIEPIFSVVTKLGEHRSFSEPNAYAADSTFLDVFDIEFVRGDSRTALHGLDKAVVSRSTALRYFGTVDVIGEVLKGKDGDLTISGVFEDLPSNTHLQFDILLSWFEMYGDPNRFTYDGFYNYIQLKEGVDIASVQARMPEFVDHYMGDFYKSRPEIRSEFGLQPVTGIHLDSHLDGEMTASGNRNIVNVLMLVACVILLIAVINYINLNTSRSLARIKEVVVRKTIGSSKSQMSMQFFTEAVILSLIATIVGLILAWSIYPAFNSLFDAHITLEILRWPEFWIALLLFLILCSLVSSFYPSWVMGRVKVQEAIKGSAIVGGRPWFQRVLVTGQFSLSLILVIATYVLIEQVRFMQSRELGFDNQQKLVIKLLPSYGEENDTTFVRNVSSLRNELISQSLSDASTVTSSIPGRKNEWRGTAGLSGMGEPSVIRHNLTRVDEDYIKTFGLKLLMGRNFEGTASDQQTVIINEEVARQFGLSPEEALGKKIDMMGNREIIGVVPTFHELGLHEIPGPSMYVTRAGYTKFLTVTLTSQNLQESIAQVEQLWKSHFPEKPFQYFFLDDYFNKQYVADITMGRSVAVFSVVAVLLACLGLFSLAAFVIHRKRKEIGIKKVLGADVVRITKELCVVFISPIFLSAFIGIPTGYWLANWWLQQYPYKIELTPIVFTLPLIGLLTLGFLTIIQQSLQAAGKNPVENLKVEN